MGKGSRRKKHSSSKNKGRIPVKDHVAEEDTDLLAEEITALTAIFQDDFKLISENPSPQLSITIRPYSMDNGLNDLNISVDLLVRCLPGYPYKAPKLHIIPAGVLSEEDLQLLHSMLLDQANSQAREGRVMVYNLVEAAQEFLSKIIPNDQDHDRNSKNSSSSIKADDKWIPKAANISSEDSHFPGGSQVCGVIDLFGDLWGEGGASWEAGVETDVALRVGSTKGKRFSEGLASRIERDTRNNGLNLMYPDPLKNTNIPVAQKGTIPVLQGRNLNNMMTNATGRLEVVQEETDSDSEVLPTKSSNATSMSDILQKVLSSFIRVGRAMKHSLRVEQTSHLDESDLKESDSSENSVSSSLATQDKSSLAFQKDLLMVHLLRLVCSSKGPLPEALPELASQLESLGILPQWARELANQQPQLFERTFRHIFCHNMMGGISNVQPSVSLFWKASPKLLGEGNASSIVNSRYQSDFEEVCLLGRGGFGHVVLCKNKLDGRHYAMKKIQLKDKSLLVNHKILREVATLSRLQHQHVVRYYQAWFETGVGGSVGVLPGGSEDLDSSENYISEEHLSDLPSDPQDRAQLTYLYIQMEYCPRTLRQVFDSYTGTIDKEVAWSMFRQIVEGLAHIHGQGIIHRDLTPNNIFFDARNDIKIGDFGLAKFSNLEQMDREYLLASELNGDSIDGTGLVGTYFYTAPEIEQAWPHIDEKVDMYSLGVVLFELWHPFGTAMERYAILSELKHKAMLPSPWATENIEQSALVKRLMAPNPSDRPSALQVLRNELPPRMEDASLNDVLRTIQSSEDTYVFDQVVSTIFDEERVLLKTQDHHSGRAKLKRDELDCLITAQSEFQDHVIEQAKEVFTQHGAHKFESKCLRVLDDPKLHNSKAIKFLNSNGDMLELCHELRLPFAYWVAANQTMSLRRYEISHVYRKGIGHAAPNLYLQGDFDVIGGAPILTEAEVIKVAMDIVGKFFPLDACEIHLNHASIIDAIWSWSGVKQEAKHDVAKLLSLMVSLSPQASDRKSKWALIRRQLLQGLHLPESTVDRLQTVERRFSGAADEVLPRLRGALPPDRFTLAALEELSTLLSYLRLWEIERHIFIDALMLPSEEYHNGIFFQIYLPKGNSYGPLSEGILLAIGARYDHLLRQIWDNHVISSCPGAVGLSVALEKILRFTSAESCKSETGTSVLVCSRGGGGLLKERMEVVAELWSANVKAEFVCTPAPSLTEQYEYANEHGIKWLVIISEDLSHTGSVKVRHLELKKEIEVPKEELVKFFIEEASMPFRKKFSLSRTSG
ncbi:eIF-2-alpha kinase GCN2 isoform X2 [Cryptomeria japonica]|uniref:eIF-2-alpha kinase GCN2 isoform X2 n=1 Tax=Cryptomeria japonica TaxID=3369 RepID=UPI0027DA7EDE|nr:eIF-2-alpha kinase GCN2 isoform X2 [Cryptomeria japonica]